MPAKNNEIDNIQSQTIPGAGEQLAEVDEKDVEAALQQISGHLNKDKTAEPKKSFFKSPKFFIMAAALLLAGLFFGVRYLIFASSHESTDDAFIEAHVIQISPKVTGHITKVYVNNNQMVKQGELLAEIDARDYEAKLAQAQAALQAAISRHSAAQINVGLTDTTSGANVQQASSVVQLSKSNVEAARAQSDAARGRLAQARAQVSTAQANRAKAPPKAKPGKGKPTGGNAARSRYQHFYSDRVVSTKQLDSVVPAARTANAQLEAARRKSAAAEAQ